jgi:hypothetical protein
MHLASPSNDNLVYIDENGVRGSRMLYAFDRAVEEAVRLESRSAELVRHASALRNETAPADPAPPTCRK